MSITFINYLCVGQIVLPPSPPGCPGVKAKNGVIKNSGATKSEVMLGGGAAKF